VNLTVHGPSFLLLISFPDQANKDDPREISLSKGEILDITNMTGKWWEVTKADGTTGSKHNLAPILLLMMS
jgi:hypothetical protein